MSSGIGQSGVVYNIGGGDTENSVTIPADPLVKTTLIRWGNFDVVTNMAHFDASDVPSGITPLGNAVPATRRCPRRSTRTASPASGRPAKAWPPIGPDVSGGNMAGLAGHVFSDPARDCYSKVMSGPADGSGSPLTFNAAACYP